MIRADSFAALLAVLQTVSGLGQLLVAGVAAFYLIRYTKETTRLREHTASQVSLAEKQLSVSLEEAKRSAEVLRMASEQLRLLAHQTRVQELPFAPRLHVRSKYLQFAPEDLHPDLIIDTPCAVASLSNTGGTAVKPFVMFRLSKDELCFADFGKLGIGGGTSEDFYLGKWFKLDLLRSFIASACGSEGEALFDEIIGLYSGFFAVICKDELGVLHPFVWDVNRNGSKMFTVTKLIRAPRGQI